MDAMIFASVRMPFRPPRSAIFIRTRSTAERVSGSPDTLGMRPYRPAENCETGRNARWASFGGNDSTRNQGYLLVRQEAAAVVIVAIKQALDLQKRSAAQRRQNAVKARTQGS